MRRLSEDKSDAIRVAVRRFLHHESAGCRFVASFAKTGEGIWWATLDGTPGANTAQILSEQIEQAEKSGDMAGLIFPTIGSTKALAALVDTLEGQARWTVERKPSERAGERVEIVRACWLNSEGTPASVMGMAPVLTMPVTRRAPCVCMFVWPGPRSNEFRTQKFPEIGIGDMKPSVPDAETYKRMTKETREKSRELNGGRLPDGATFILPR